MRPPLSAIEPARRGVSMLHARRRRERGLAGERLAGHGGRLAGRLRSGCPARLRRRAGLRRGPAAARERRRLLRVLLRLLLLLVLLLLLHLRQADEILPADQHERRQHDGEDGVLLVVISALFVPAYRAGRRSASLEHRSRRSALKSSTCVERQIKAARRPIST